MGPSQLSPIHYWTQLWPPAYLDGEVTTNEWRLTAMRPLAHSGITSVKAFPPLRATCPHAVNTTPSRTGTPISHRTLISKLSDQIRFFLIINNFPCLRFQSSLLSLLIYQSPFFISSFQFASLPGLISVACWFSILFSREPN